MKLGDLFHTGVPADAANIEIAGLTADSRKVKPGFLFAALAVQFAFKAPLEHPMDVAIGVGLLVPALGDWAWGRFHPSAFGNAWRTATGVLLGLALGRTLFIHLQRPLPPALLFQMALVTGVATPVILATYRRTTRK